MRHLLRLGTLTIAFLSLVAPLFAQEAEKWAPPEPSKAERDWIQLTSGEWLWGDIEFFQDLDLLFDSEELDDLTLDWGDIVAIRSARILTYTFTRDRVATGTAVMQDGIITIRTVRGDEQYSRRELLKIIEGELSELNYWSLKGSLGWTLRSGNTDQYDFNTVANLRREATRSRIDFDYNGNYSRVDTVDTVNNSRFQTGLNIIITRGFFVSPFLGEIYGDQFQNIKVRYTAGVGLGYWITRSRKLDWNVQFGCTYRKTEFISVEAGQASTNETASFVPATVFEWDITGDIDLDINYNAQVGIHDPKNTTHHLQAYLAIEILNDWVDLTANFTWDRVESPQTNADGVTPKRDDYRFALGIGVDI